MNSVRFKSGWIAGCLNVVWLTAAGSVAQACPYCPTMKSTFFEDVRASDVAAIAELISMPDPPDSRENLPSDELIDSYKGKFRITKVLKGDQHVSPGDTVVAIYTGTEKPGVNFLMCAVDPADLQWASPQDLTERSQEYIEQVLKLPEATEKRLSFFVDYLDDEDEMLQNDAYEEFARADYDEVKAIKDEIDRERLVEWIKKGTAPNHIKSLHFTLLSVCGRLEDAKMLEDALISEDDSQLTQMVASMASCYLTLMGVEGLPLIEDRFLRGGVLWDPEYVHTYGAIMAIRFLGERGGVIERARLVQSLRLVLQRPQLADLVIRDLARWEDWEAMPQLVQLFKDADTKTHWVRVPIVNYLRACPLPEAKDHIEELAKIDPDAIKRATSLFPVTTTRQTQVTSPETDQKSSGKVADALPETQPQEPQPSEDNSPRKAASTPVESGSAVKQAEKAPSAAVRDTSLMPWIIIIPAAGVVVLLAVMWLILRPTSARLPAKNQ